MKRVFRSVVVATLVGVTAVSCGGDDSSVDSGVTAAPAGETPATDTPSTDAPSTDAPATDAVDDGVLNVPDEFPTIQEAVDAASEGELVLIAPGTYNEAVQVTTNNIVIRGLDRNTTILDGNFELDNGIRVVGAEGVAVENLTAMNYTKNGFFWTGANGYRGSYLTAWRNGDYGIYAFDSVGGLLEHSYGAGSPDAGVYIGQCYPCDAVIDDFTAEYNGLGYSGTNSGGNLLIVNSVFRRNRAGIVPNSGSYELCYPERETTIVGNLVYDNNNGETPAIDVAILAMGNGILSAGGVGNIIERNRVWDHNRTGIGLVPYLEEDPNDKMPTPDQWDMPCSESKKLTPQLPDGPLLWDSQKNIVRDNVVENSGEADLAVASAGTDLWTLDNCFEGNTAATTAPTNLVGLSSCTSGVSPDGDWLAGDLNVIRWLAEQESMPKSADWKTAQLPEMPVLDNMPDAATAKAVPASKTPPVVDLAAITVPDKIS